MKDSLCIWRYALPTTIIKLDGRGLLEVRSHNTTTRVDWGDTHVRVLPAPLPSTPALVFSLN
ncbi:hypothetical protein I8748_30020 [Nostoc sp. CENA67]|uniref:Uncharacterized protein n=1 Tax=Amazonocrinis nigriterrae CENA67 TaxID=2794033 RepID=A0A8J7LCB9_9NOST|nr:hypothetical protein [Amazonocrinis nigriterrae]MBH8566341.1 hypothetical protein [Amazonocrinis nigriterrae CENA67]